MTDTPLKVVHDYRLTAEEAITLGRSASRHWSSDELADRTGHAGPADRDGARGGRAARARRAAAAARAGRVLGLWPARGPRCSRACPPAALREDPLLAGARDFGRSRSRLPEIGAAMGALDRHPRCAARPPSSSALRLAACEVSDSAWREHPALRAREAFYRLAQYPFIGIDHRRAGVHRLRGVHPLRGQSGRSVHPPDLDPAAGGRNGGAPSSWGTRCSWATGSRRPSPICWPPAVCGSPATSCGSICRHRMRRPTRRSSSRGCARSRRRSGLARTRVVTGALSAAQAGSGSVQVARDAPRPPRSGRHASRSRGTPGDESRPARSCDSRRSRMLRQISRSDSGSSALVTSSRISSRGSRISARASAMRWRWPPESRAALGARPRCARLRAAGRRTRRPRRAAGPPSTAPSLWSVSLSVRFSRMLAWNRISSCGT